MPLKSSNEEKQFQCKPLNDIGRVCVSMFGNETFTCRYFQVFLQATPLQGRLVSQSNMIKKLRLFLGLGAAWVVLTIVLQVIYVLAFGVDDIKGHSVSERYSIRYPCLNKLHSYSMIKIGDFTPLPDQCLHMLYLQD
jgi:hypothetical protein